jgi:putative ABC transport system permease protein
MMRHLVSDVRFALRLLRRWPAFFATLLAIIAVGIGATTAMFSIVEALLLRPLPFPDAGQLTALRVTTPRAKSLPVSVPDFIDWKAQSSSFEKIAASAQETFGLSSQGAKPERLEGASVSGEFFQVFGTKPLLGRLLSPEDDRIGGPRVAVVSAAVWHRRFGSDPNLVSRTITLNGLSYTVIGVAAEGFRFARLNRDRADIWTPLSIKPEYPELTSSGRGWYFLHVMGRRKSGITLGQAQAELSVIAKGLEAAYPETNTAKDVRVSDLREYLVDSSRSGVWVLFVAVGLAFLVACSNIANLLLTRAEARRSEMAARAALGAAASRLMAQIVTETVVVFVIGSLGGCALANLLVELFAAAVIDRGVASAIDVQVDTVALAVTIGTCFTCGVVFGLVPALAVARVHPQAVLKETAAQTGTSHSRTTTRNALVTAQVAVAFALLAGSGLATKGFAKVASIPPGFDARNLATGRVTLPEARYGDHNRALTFFGEALSRLAARPDVEKVAASSSVPVGDAPQFAFAIEGRAPPPRGEEPSFGFHTVTPGYFQTVRIPLLRGRDFGAGDDAHGRPVVIVSQAMADRFFPGEDPMGRRLDWDLNGEQEHVWREIVGVVGDVRREGLDHPIEPDGYVPFAQNPDCREMVLTARSPRPEMLLRDLPGLVQSIDADQDVAELYVVSDRVADSIKNQRYVTFLLGAFAFAALILATLGIFGLASHTTDQRAREIGLRMALGSTSEAVVGIVMKGALRSLAFGVGAGAIGAAIIGRTLASRIPGVVAFDFAIYAAIIAVLTVACLVACLIPARRASKIAPAIALREA